MSTPTTTTPRPVAPIDYGAPLSEHLRPGERLLWHGRPRQGLILRTSDILLIPFSVVWCHGVLEWERRAITAGCVALIGLPFAAIGVYLLVGRFVHDVWQRRHTWYGLTDRGRAVIVSGGPARGVVSFELRQIRELEVHRHWGGRDNASIRFLEFGKEQPDAPGWHLPGMEEAWVGKAFEYVDDADEILRHMRALDNLPGPVRRKLDAQLRAREKEEENQPPMGHG